MKFDDILERKIGSLEMANLRLSFLLETQKMETARLAALVTAKEAEIEKLILAAAEPLLPIEGSGGNGGRPNGEVQH